MNLSGKDQYPVIVFFVVMGLHLSLAKLLRLMGALGSLVEIMS